MTTKLRCTASKLISKDLCVKHPLTSVLLIFILFFKNTLFAQSYIISIPESQLQVLSISVNYIFTSSTYTPINPSINLQRDALASIQERYNNNHALISSEYRKLKQLKLINTENQIFLEQYRKQKIENLDIRQYDLSINSTTSKILKYMCEIYELPEIRNELRILSDCEYELRRLKNSNPVDYYTTKRYRAIAKLLNKLSTCKKSEIGSLNWEYFELQEDLERKEKESIRYVISTKLNVRQLATTNSPIIFTLRLGDEVKLIEKINENWSKIEIPESNEFIQDIISLGFEPQRIGYVYNSYISK